MRQRFLIVFILSAWLLGQIWIPAPLKAQTVIASSWRPDTPPARQGHALAAGDGAVFLFGGETDDSELRLLNDLWVWRDGAWQWLASNGPSPRSWAALAYDEQRNELILFGGWNGLSELNDTWVWRDGQWSRRTPAQSPPARRRHDRDCPAGRTVPATGMPVPRAPTALGSTTHRSDRVVAARASAIGCPCHPRPIPARNGVTPVVTAQVWRCGPAVRGAAPHHADHRCSMVATCWVRSNARTVATVKRPPDRVFAIPNLLHARTGTGGVLRWSTVRDPHAVHADPAAW